MIEEIKVYVYRRNDKKNLYMKYVDPMTGRPVSKSTGKSKKKEASMVAGAWQAELREGRYKAPSKVTWEEFEERYENEVVPSMAERTAGKIDAVFNWIKRELNPDRLSKLTSERLSFLQRRMREEGLAEASIKGHMAHLKSSLNWAKRTGLLNEVPEIVMPKRAKTGKVMKGRPVTGEEFDRLLDAVAGEILSDTEREELGEDAGNHPRVESWKHLLRGLWWSGLRLGEALELTWDDDKRLRVDVSGKYVVISIPAELEKGNQDRLLPVAPQFAEMLLAVPEEDRKGFVFNPEPNRIGGTRLTMLTVSKRISNIGQKAGIKVDEKNGKTKFASAHDLRRSYGERWAALIMPKALKELMRHESIDTTMKYYVGQNAQATAEMLYSAVNCAPQGSPAENIEESKEEEKMQAPTK